MKYIILFLIILTGAVFGQYIVNCPGGLVIELDTLDAFFAIGDTSGNPLMFDYHVPWVKRASYFNVMIDSVIYTNMLLVSSICGATHLRSMRGPISASYDGFSTQWNIPMDTTGSIILTQSLRAVIIDTLPACEICYMAYNNDDINHKIAFYQNFDVLVGSNDVAPMALGAAYSGLGGIFGGAEVPYFWQAFEIGPGGGTDQVVARGILRGLATTPEIFAYGEQEYLSDDCWDPDPAVIDHGYGDSGVSLRWAEYQVNPGKAYEICTIYGFGEAPEPGAGVIMLALVPNTVGSACDDWARNPFEVAVLVYNVSVSPTLDSVRVCIYPDDGFVLWSDATHSADTCLLLAEALPPDSTAMGAWLVWADTAFFTSGPADPSIITLFTTTTSGVEPIAETTFVHIPDPVGVPPTIEVIEIPDWAISCTGGLGLDMKYYIEDDGGIDPSSMILQIGSEIKYLGDDFVEWADDTLTLGIPAYYLIHGNRVYFGIIAVSDSDGCIPDSIPLIDKFWVDTEPPFIGPPYPPSGAVMNDPNTAITFPIVDWPAGVDELSIFTKLSIDGDITYYNILDAELSFVDSILTFEPGADWPDSSDIVFCILQVADDVDADYCPPNILEDSVCVSFKIIYSAISEDGKPLVFNLSFYPNPFNATVNIEAPLADRVEIFDISGHKVADLSERFDSVVSYRTVWDGTDGRGSRLPSGIYLIRAVRGERTIVKRVVLLR
ncbi:hypothetical protein DRQ36_09695 [bacterium]|nr:MAG: hypothetical protein DRQ36_09695 [bacterium]